MNTRTFLTGRRHRIGPALALATVCAVVGLVGTTGTLAFASGTTSTDAPTSASANSPNGSSAAVVTPLLEMFEFGNTIGLPLACTDAGSIVSIIGASAEASKEVSPLTLQLDNQCSELSSKGDGYLQQAIAESQGLSLINPLVNPLIADLANGFTTTGTQYGASMSPFGPTVAGLGGTVAFFEGT
jgi:hypothetical protein